MTINTMVASLIRGDRAAVTEDLDRGELTAASERATDATIEADRRWITLLRRASSTSLIAAVWRR